MSLTLEQLFEMQKALDARIIAEKKLEGVDLLPNTVLALQVEIGELANEWRGFKHWSNDRKPRIEKRIPCEYCLPFNDAPCDKCGDKGYTLSNPLLEEYVDCLHFFLSIANQLDLPSGDLYSPGPDEELQGNTTNVFTEILQHVGGIGLHEKPDIRRHAFRLGLWVFYALGEKRLGFNFEQIAAAYVAKNEVNHNRQSNGY